MSGENDTRIPRDHLKSAPPSRKQKATTTINNCTRPLIRFFATHATFLLKRKLSNQVRAPRAKIKSSRKLLNLHHQGGKSAACLNFCRKFLLFHQFLSWPTIFFYNYFKAEKLIKMPLRHRLSAHRMKNTVTPLVPRHSWKVRSKSQEAFWRNRVRQGTVRDEWSLIPWHCFWMLLLLERLMSSVVWSQRYKIWKELSKIYIFIEAIE